jgi:ribosomal-protein-alanine acetyltransferase
MSVSIRTAILDDIPDILVIEQAAPGAAHWSAEQYKSPVERGCLLVAESEGRFCGFLCFRVAAGEWELENVVVAQSSLRRGIADSLMRTLIACAQKAGASGIQLEVRESNLPARRLYEKHGFQEVGRRAQYYHDPLDDAILYTLLPRS